MSTTLWRTVQNAWRVGIKRYAYQVATMNDSKSGRFIGKDGFGNKFYETENPEEIHLRSRWVEYDQGIHTVYETSVIEPGWALWLRYGVDVPPSEMTAEELPVRAYPMPERHQPNLTFTRGAYVPYNTAKPKVQGWAPQVRDRA